MMSVPLHTEPSAGPGLPRLAANVVAFQLGWLACVVGAAQGLQLAGLLFAGAVLAMHLAVSARPAREAVLLAAAVVIGLVCDSALLQLGWIEYAGPGPWPALAPLWILALWALFATTLNVSMRWLQQRPVVAACLGSVAGPLSYLGAQRLGACRVLEPVAAVCALAVGWAVLTPLLLALARRLDAAHADAAAAGARRV